jgi:hypothetical protein
MFARVWRRMIMRGASGPIYDDPIKSLRGSRRLRACAPIGMAVLRYILHLIDSLPLFLGFLSPIWDVQRQTLADKVMRSLVLKVDRSDAWPLG